MLKQSYPSTVNPKTIRIFGKHLKHKVNGKTVVHTNEDVTVFDAAYSKNNIQKFPTIVLRLFPKLRTMYLQRMKLGYLIRGSFVNCKNLRSIYFADDVIQTAESGVFSNCTNLMSLNFTNNLIRKMDDGVFNNLTRLEKLTFNKNGLKGLNATLFKDVKGLVELTISFQPLTSLPVNIFNNMTRLQILNLTHNRLQVIYSDYFKSKPFLRKVNLDGNEIASVDPKIFEVWPRRATLTFVTNSCFNGNLGMIDRTTKAVAAKKFEKCFENFKKLSLASKVNETLTNKTTVKPTNLTTTTKKPAKKGIKKSDLFKKDNKKHDNDSSEDSWLTSMKKHIFGKKKNTTKATTTTTMKPKIRKTVVSPITRDQAIARFYVNAKNEYCGVIKDATRFIKNISMKHLPGYSNTNVTVIHFIKSKLINIPSLVIKTFPNVQKIAATRCGIQVIDSDLLEECGKLRILDLSNNKIRFVSGKSLQLCPSLEVIDLSKNMIERIESNIFQCNPKLTIEIDKVKIVPPAK